MRGKEISNKIILCRLRASVFAPEQPNKLNNRPAHTCFYCFECVRSLTLLFFINYFQNNLFFFIKDNKMKTNINVLLPLI
jgi:hypothetical protein